MNAGALFKLSGAWKKFTANHPKFPQFLNAAKEKGVPEGMTVSIILTYPDGTCLKYGMKLKAEDVELFNSLAGAAE